MSRKEQVMEFKLQSQLGGNFTNAFKSAQNQLASMQSEIKKLNSVQSDISAYQKQQAAVKTTENDLKALEEQYARVKKEIETSGESKELLNAQSEYERKIANTNIKLGLQRDTLNQTAESLDKAGISTKDLTGESERLSTELEKLKQEQMQAAESAQRFGDQSARAMNDLSQAIAAAGVAVALKEIYEGFMDCVNVAGDFEASMSNVEALSGASGENLQALSEKAKEMGAATSFTAQQSADAFSYMALAGWDTESMLVGIEPVLNLAAAANMDLAEASDIVTDYLTAFGLSASDTGRFVDIMSYAMSKSNTNVTQLGEAYKGCAATANSMGFSVEDTTAAIMTMANAGVKGGEAGTALNAIMTRLATDTKNCASTLDEYGVSVYDAEGNMNSLSSILNGLSGIWAGLTDQEQANLAKTIAGTNQYSKLQTIMLGCSEAAAESGMSFNDYADALKNCSGTAGAMATTMLDNLNGKATLAQSAWEGMTIAIGEQFTPTVSGAYEILANVYSGIGTFVQEYPLVVKALAAITVGVGSFVAAITAYTVAVKLARIASEAFNAMMAANPWYLAIAAGAAIAATAVTFLATAMNQQRDVSEELIGASKEQEEELKALNAQYEIACTVFGETSPAAQELALEVGQLSSEYERNKKTIREMQEETERLQSAIADTKQAYQDASGDTDTLYDSSVALISQLAVLSSRSDLTTTDLEWMSQIVTKLNGNYEGLGLTLDKVTGKLNFDIPDLYDYVKNAAEQQKQQNAYKALIGYMGQYETAQRQEAEAYKSQKYAREEYLKILNTGKDQWWGDETWMKTWDINGAGKAYEEWNQQQEQWIARGEEVEEVTSNMRDTLQGLGYTEEEVASFMEEMTSGSVDLSAAMEQSETSAEDFEIAAAQAFSGVQTDIQNLCAAYDEAYQKASESFEGQYGIFDTATANMEQTVAATQEALNSQQQYWSDYSSNLEYLREVNAESIGMTEDEFSSFIAFLSDGSEQSAGLAASIVDNLKNGGAAGATAVKEMINTWGKVQEAQKSATENAAAVATQFDSEMQKLVISANKAIRDMDISDEAKISATNTMTSYADAIRNAGANATQKAREIASEVQRILNGISTTVTINASGSVKIGKHAKGTMQAEEAYIAGEAGAELILDHPGATVFPASETNRIINAVQEYQSAKNIWSIPAAVSSFTPMDIVSAVPAASGGASYVISISPQYTINSSSNEGLKQILEEHDEGLRDYIVEVIEGEVADRERRVFV